MPEAFLKPKIVATLGSPQAGDKRPMDLSGEPFGATYECLVNSFCDEGVDVIRLNFSHLKGRAGDVVRQVGDAIRKWEEGKDRRVALLADLPGPKIRAWFKEGQPGDYGAAEKPIALQPGQDFEICFESVAASAERVTVCIDGIPVRGFMDRLDREAPQRGPSRKQLDDYLKQIMRKRRESITQNLLEWLVPVSGPRNSFESFMSGLKELVARRPLAFIADDDVILAAQEVLDDPPRLRARVLRAISVSGEKGFTIKGLDFHVPAFTQSDEGLLREILQADQLRPDGSLAEEPVVAFVAVSFAQTAFDILVARYGIQAIVRDLIGESQADMPEAEIRGRLPSIIAKIETAKGHSNRHYILDLADGLMVARGDLGLQSEIERVPILQKDLVKLSRKRGKTVIVATQMLLSMKRSVEPTRAEVSDVFNAILDGADAVMLSEETASGAYPLHSIRKMRQIARQAQERLELEDRDSLLTEQEANQFRKSEMGSFLWDDYKRIEQNRSRLDHVLILFQRLLLLTSQQDALLVFAEQLYAEKLQKAVLQDTTNRITEAACLIAESGGFKMLVAATTSGRTVSMVARLRPKAIIVGAAHHALTTRKLVLTYGVFPIKIRPARCFEGAAEKIYDDCQAQILASKGLQFLLNRGDRIVFTSGTPAGDPGTTNLLTVVAPKPL